MILTIDPEFKEWIIPLRDDEFKELEKSVLEDGCRDSLIIWKGIVVDGHHRYKICTDHNIPFKTTEKEFPDRDAVKLWMVSNQIARRNLESIQRIALVMKGEELIAQRAREHLITAEPGVRGGSPLVNLPKAIDTRKEVAAQAKVSEKTYAKGKEVLLKRPEVMNKIISGETSIHKEYTEIKKEEKLQERREELAQKTLDAQKLPNTITLYHANFLTDYKLVPANSIDCIITDPPYVKEWLDNYAGFADAAEYVLKPGGFLVTYLGHIHLDKILAQMTPHLEYYWIAMLKHAGTNKAVHSRSVQCGMKPILIFNKAPRMKPKRYFNDVIIGTGKEKDAHEWQQGEEELRMIFEPFTDPGDTVLDPFMGSGTTIVMAKKLNRIAIGFDINNDNINVVKGRLMEG